MKNKQPLLFSEILEAMSKHGSQKTYVIANLVCFMYPHHRGIIKTPQVLRKLKLLEKNGVVERVESTGLDYCWRYVRKSCAVSGRFSSNTSCGQYIIETGMCGHISKCEHQK